MKTKMYSIQTITQKLEIYNNPTWAPCFDGAILIRKDKDGGYTTSWGNGRQVVRVYFVDYRIVELQCYTSTTKAEAKAIESFAHKHNLRLNGAELPR